MYRLVDQHAATSPPSRLLKMCQTLQTLLRLPDVTTSLSRSRPRSNSDHAFATSANSRLDADREIGKSGKLTDVICAFVHIYYVHK